MATCKQCARPMVTQQITHAHDGKRAILFCPFCGVTRHQLNDEDVEPTGSNTPPLRSNTIDKKRAAFERILNNWKSTKGTEQ